MVGSMEHGVVSLIELIFVNEGEGEGKAARREGWG
jgi:hypothetical protein